MAATLFKKNYKAVHSFHAALGWQKADVLQSGKVELFANAFGWKNEVNFALELFPGGKFLEF